MNRRALLAGLVSFPFLGAAFAREAAMTQWKLTREAEALVPGEKLRRQILKALEAAKTAGTEPTISHFQVRAATVVEWNGTEHTAVGGNTEYAIPEALHGESSLLSHVTAQLGPETTRRAVRFVAYYQPTLSNSGSCGDCRDYQMAVTDFEQLLVVRGVENDHTVHVTRFREQLVFEQDFPRVNPLKLPVSPDELDLLVNSALEAREGGVTLFTTTRHTAAAGISFRGKTYRAAGADDAAFHYRYPIGGLLQQAATERDYFLRAIFVAGEKGQWPIINYRDRQYGFEASSFNQKTGKPPIALVLIDGLGNYRLTSFEDALPAAFSTARFMPQALTNFLESHEKKE
jgi:cytidine deaminase